MSGATRAAAAPRLYDRTTELAAVAGLSARAAAGAGGVLLVAGGPGLGRTALLDRAVRDAPVRAHRVAAPSGNRVPWSGVRALLAALAPTPAAARAALRVARGPGGVAGALTALRAGEPLLLGVDDHHLWDAHSRAALATAWRAGSGPWAWVVSLAGHHRPPDVPGARLLRLAPLGREGAAALLDEVCRSPLKPAVRARLVDEAAGHPGLLTAMAARLSAAQLAGETDLPVTVADDGVLRKVYQGILDSLPAECGRVLTLVAIAGEAGPGAGEDDAGAAHPAGGPVRHPSSRSGARPVAADAVLAVARTTRTSPEALDRLVADGLLRGPREALRFEDPFLRRAVLGAVPTARRRDLRALFTPPREPGVPPGPARTSVPRDPGPHGSALVRGAGHRADRLRPADEVRALPGVVRGRAELARGLAGMADGPVADAHQVLLLAASLLREDAPEEAADARFLAMEAAWSAGDADACATALAAGDGPGGAAGPGAAGGDGAERDFRDGMRAALAVRLHEAREPLARVVARDGVSDEPRLLLRAGAAALVLGDAASAVRVHSRALAAVRAERRTALLPRVLEHLSYAELRAGRHERAAAHAREGLRAAHLTGQRNSAAHQHAVLALAASVAGDTRAVAEHAGRALVTARPHGLAQATTLAEWSLARAELGGGLAAHAAARLAPLVGPGPRSGHFALRMLAVPCFVEAACAAGRRADAHAAAEEFAVWSDLGLDPQAPAQLARCRALLAATEDSARWYGEAVRQHADCGNDFERARTLLAYGKWLRRRRRPVEARAPLSDALVTFERASAGVWADQARAELRATGGAVGGTGPVGAAGELTPQQQRIAGLVADGATNREIADRLSLSPRTVDHHLRNVFARLGVRSRVELSGVLSRAARDGRGGPR
ncbi:LuxR C-terminal-related transcriptional regulator [Streptomyces sp. NPDC058745]|uniref:helix-turn-helix transcriptional regulator n=1 Tax=Streptomyces sp. NPDC058745 TaxID=3346621 RepID=UPI0036B61527